VLIHQKTTHLKYYSCVIYENNIYVTGVCGGPMYEPVREAAPYILGFAFLCASCTTILILRKMSSMGFLSESMTNWHDFSVYITTLIHYSLVYMGYLLCFLLIIVFIIAILIVINNAYLTWWEKR